MTLQGDVDMFVFYFGLPETAGVLVLVLYLWAFLRGEERAGAAVYCVKDVEISF